jgi:hypothetical protein
MPFSGAALLPTVNYRMYSRLSRKKHLRRYENRTTISAAYESDQERNPIKQFNLRPLLRRLKDGNSQKTSRS